MTAICDALVNAGLTTEKDVHVKLAKHAAETVEEIIKERTEEYHERLFWEFVNRNYRR